jgi:hypothetical protein
MVPASLLSLTYGAHCVAHVVEIEWWSMGLVGLADSVSTPRDVAEEKCKYQKDL